MVVVSTDNTLADMEKRGQEAKRRGGGKGKRIRMQMMKGFVVAIFDDSIHLRCSRSDKERFANFCSGAENGPRGNAIGNSNGNSNAHDISR